MEESKIADVPFNLCENSREWEVSPVFLPQSWRTLSYLYSIP